MLWNKIPVIGGLFSAAGLASNGEVFPAASLAPDVSVLSAAGLVLSIGPLLPAICLLMDALFGDPSCITHPVIWMGKAIKKAEHLLRRCLPGTPGGELAGGGILALLLTGGTLFLSGTVLYAAGRVHPVLWTALQLFWGWQCLAMKGLGSESRAVQEKLETGTLEQARAQVARIVGRDTRQLSREGVVRAAVETVAENFSDGVIAPLFYYIIGGAPLALCYKAINTMDSMVGYKNDRYRYFGRIPARLDDAANWIPSRLSALLLIASAFFCRENASSAAAIWKRDRRNHASPNSAQTESVMAGALGIRLGGGASYFGQWHEKPYIGDDLRTPVPSDIRRANRMMYVGSVMAVIIGVLILR